MLFTYMELHIPAHQLFGLQDNNCPLPFKILMLYQFTLTTRRGPLIFLGIK